MITVCFAAPAVSHPRVVHMLFWSSGVALTMRLCKNDWAWPDMWLIRMSPDFSLLGDSIARESLKANNPQRIYLFWSFTRDMRRS